MPFFRCFDMLFAIDFSAFTMPLLCRFYALLLRFDAFTFFFFYLRLMPRRLLVSTAPDIR